MKPRVLKLVFGLFFVFGMLWVTSNSVLAQSFLPGFTQDELDNNWGQDRTFPSGGVTSVTAFGRQNVAELGIDNTQTQPGTFYRTEGIKTTAGNFGTEVQVDLYLDSDWQDKAVRAGLWVDDDDGAGNPNFYGIIEFVNVETCAAPNCTNYDSIPTHTGFRIWDSTSGWFEPYLATPFEWDTWVTLRIVLDTTAGEYQYYINDELVGTTDAGNNFIREVFFNSYNFGLDDFPTLTSDSYTAHWNNGAPTVQPCTEYQNVFVTPINEGSYGLDWSQQRATGHHEYQSDSLRLYTESNTTTDKVAGYFILDAARPLTEIGDVVLNYTANFGIPPGGQLVIDINNNNVYDVNVDPTLVLEDAYQESGEEPIWWSHYDFGVGSTISDYATLANLNKILEKNPGLKFIAYGWSLGSGVYGDGKITSFTAACVHYTFGLAKVTPEEPDRTPIVACNTYGSITLKETEGVVYTADPENAVEGEVTVSATAEPGYQLENYTGPWTYDLGDYYLCPAQVVTPIPVPITHCDMQGNIYYFSTPGVIYTETPDSATEGEVVVTAEAAAGYELVGYTGPWTFDLGTFEACVPEVVTNTETVTVTQPITVNIPVTTEVPVTITQPITVNIPVTTEVPVTVTQPITVNIPVTTEVPVTVTQPITVNVPVTTEVPITTVVPVTNTVIVTTTRLVTETVIVTDSVTYVEPGWPVFKDPVCADHTVDVTVPDSDRVAYSTEGEDIPGSTVTVRAHLKKEEENVFLAGTTAWIHSFPTIDSLNCNIGDQNMYLPRLAK